MAVKTGRSARQGNGREQPIYPDSRGAQLSAYPAGFFDTLLRLIVERPNHVLDLGCGTGNRARPLALRVDHVDAIDPEEALIERGKRLPNGVHDNLHWIVGRIEEFPLRPGYTLAIVGERLRRMPWQRIIPRLRSLLAPGGLLAIIEQDRRPLPWDRELNAIIRRYRTGRADQSRTFVERLQAQGLFQAQGRLRFGPLPLTQTSEAYIESLRAQTSFALEGITRGDGRAFDEEIRNLVLRYHPKQVTVIRTATVIWGYPLDKTGQKEGQVPEGAP